MTHKRIGGCAVYWQWEQSSADVEKTQLDAGNPVTIEVWNYYNGIS